MKNNLAGVPTETDTRRTQVRHVYCQSVAVSSLRAGLCQLVTAHIVVSFIGVSFSVLFFKLL